MNRTWNQYVVKRENKTLVLTTIINHMPISRANVAQVTGLNKGTVSSLVSELIDEELVKELGPGESSGGRRPVMLLFNGNAGYSISIELAIGNILGVITDLNGQIVNEENIPLQTTDFNTIFPIMTQLIKKLIQQAPKSRYGIVGLGIGVPAVVSQKGEILLAPNLDWKNINLKEKLSEIFHLPIYVENEANAGAYGEMRYGSSQESKHMIYTSLGIGIGTGMILDGKLYHGLSGFAGELGHMTIIKDGRSCRCGNHGCWERYASEQALIDEGLNRQLITNDQAEPLDELIKLAAAGDKEVIKLFEEIGTYIAIGLTNCINIFNPEHVIIGNKLMKAKEWIYPVIEAYIHDHAIGFHQNKLKIDSAKLGIYSPVSGMAAFVIEGFLFDRKTTQE
ncbi:ROK family protein [Amphibacillus sp. MSJ-3]|uniref:ROK family transcriptional regulator n=1 Tax=Amphibacillus sp. MSJ-3 TaxID=2841505 RepID=UPI001C0E9F3A|nr:ROK family transcriptional regulator [Amphibacillus sp. MSJ-3]MBU5593949.1 ROK family protein [Amphibacillus sp. MSJ-3]